MLRCVQRPGHRPLPAYSSLLGVEPELCLGDSVLLSVVEAIKQADGTAANIASLVFEAKVNIIRLPDFMQNIGNAEYRAKILERYTLAATAKGINGDLLLDKEEEFEQKTASFATLPEVLMAFLQIVSGAADIPATRLLGQPPAGMNATGESDLCNYYDRLQAMQEVEMTPAMMQLDECIIRSGTGSRDADIYYEWAPLWGMSEKEKADVVQNESRRCAPVGGYFAGSGNYSPRSCVRRSGQRARRGWLAARTRCGDRGIWQAERAGALRRRACGRSSRTVKSGAMNPSGSSRGREYHHKKCGPE